MEKKLPKKITPVRLKNIALYYLKRFETTQAGLRAVLKRRVDAYWYYDKELGRFNVRDKIGQEKRAENIKPMGNKELNGIN